MSGGCYGDVTHSTSPASIDGRCRIIGVHDAVDEEICQDEQMGERDVGPLGVPAVEGNRQVMKEMQESQTALLQDEDKCVSELENFRQTENGDNHPRLS